MSGIRVGAMLTQRCSVLRLTGQHTRWQMVAKRSPRLQRTVLTVRSAAATAVEGSQQQGAEASPAEEGVKAKLFRILGPVQDPITAEELWPLASAEGLKSKTFMKQMLNDLRMKGKVDTKPARGKTFGYILPEKWAALKKQAKSAAATDVAKPKQVKDPVKGRDAAKPRR